MRSVSSRSDATMLPNRPGKATFWVIGMLAIAIFGVILSLTLGDRTTTAQVVDAADMHTVGRGDFEIMIPASGELVAGSQVEIRNLLETRAVITEVVGEGSFVRKGDIVLRLADDELVEWPEPRSGNFFFRLRSKRAPPFRVGELLTVAPTPMLTALAKKYGGGERERERERDESPPRYRLKVERIRHRLEETAGASGMISAVLE